MRRKLIAGNWKMNKDIHETADLLTDLKSRLSGTPDHVDTLVCPPFTSLVVAKGIIQGTSIKLGAQNMSEKDDCALTGEISARMLKEVGCEYVLVGHSERRQFFKETNDIINAKARKALASHLTPIICVGETLEEREAGVTEQIVTTQIKGVLVDIKPEELFRVVIAYEPVWAIGTGKNATPEEANQVHKLIRKQVGRMYSWSEAEKLAILYGGSVNQQNRSEERRCRERVYVLV